MAANPNNYPPKSAAFVITQDRAGYIHKLYRTTGHSDVNWTEPGHIAGLATWTQPVGGLGAYQQGPAPGSAAARALLNASVANRGMVGLRDGIFRVGHPGPRPSAFARGFAQGVMNAAVARQRLASTNISHVRQLGWGKEGTATLWHYSNPAGGSGNLVCKVRFPDSIAEFLNERAKLRRLARSPHIVHRAAIWRSLWPHANNQVFQDAFDLELSTDHSWTEYARHGDLGQLIAKVSVEGETFPRSVLWRFFSCLTEACVAMAYPPREQANPPHALYGPDLPETIPAAPLQGFVNIVHLGLDPSNVFVDDYNNTHADVPRLQVGDFGLSATPSQLGLPTFMPPMDFARMSMLWNKRTGGKDGWHLPEQFSGEWDRVNYEPYSEGLTDFATGAGAAGAFTEKSNIFHVGLVIWCCMLLHMPETPPRLTPTPRSGPNMGSRGWTYVGEMRMRDYHGTFGRALCELVGDCCRHMPADRPCLVQLRARVAAGAAANPVTVDDARWVRRMLDDPARPNPEPGVLAPGAVALFPF